MPLHETQPLSPPRPELRSVDGRTYPLESARVTGRAEGGIAATTLVQRFANPHDEPLEVIYTLPLPADGAVLGYTVRMGERVIRGEVQPREAAEKAYRDAIYQGRTAGLLEQDRSDTFQQRLGNLPPRTDVEIEIVVLHPLRFLGAIDDKKPQWEYRFPTVVGIRYQGDAGRVPDAERLDVDRGAEGSIPTRVELDLTIVDDTVADEGVSSPSHAIACEAITGAHRVRLAHGERLDRDIVLRWEAASPQVGVRLVEGRGLDGDDGRYALVTVVPPRVTTEVLNRDVTVLIDGSGSMQGEPLALAKRVVRELVGSLEIGDRFELLVFSNDVVKLTHGLVYATPKLRQEAIDRLDRVQASGGTEMLDAVEQALGSLRNDAQRQIVLVTDGQVSFEAEVIGRIARQSLGGSRVHAVGIGSAPNRALLRGIAAAGRGVELSASDAATATEAALRLCTATVSPVLVDLSASGDAVLAAAPAAPRDVFAGQPALLTLELAPAGGTLELRGRLAGAAEPWVWRTTVPAAGADRPPASTLPIGAIHGRERILDLELEQMCTPDAAAIDVRIEACAMRHRIVSSRTSLVAIAEVPTVDPRAPRRRERLAVEVPLGVSAEGSGLLPGAVQWVMGSSMLFCFEAEMPLRSMAHRMKSSLFTGPVVARTERLGLAGTVLRVERGIVVLEFEVPFDDFELPRGGVEIRLPDGRTMRGRIDRTASSPAGPHAQGLLVRMALRLKRDQGWRDGATIEVIWNSSIVRWGGKRMPIEFTLVATLPPERGEHAAT